MKCQAAPTLDEKATKQEYSLQSLSNDLLEDLRFTRITIAIGMTVIIVKVDLMLDLKKLRPNSIS
ncbi:hypothetical protein OAH05_03105 [bacterium]|nr:hypothetical protein [bacterium]